MGCERYVIHQNRSAPAPLGMNEAFKSTPPLEWLPSFALKIVSVLAGQRDAVSGLRECRFMMCLGRIVRQLFFVRMVAECKLLHQLVTGAVSRFLVLATETSGFEC